jgi:hypothetical protein
MKKNALKQFFSLVLFIVLAACATGPTQYKTLALTAEQQQDVDSQPATLKPAFAKLYREGRRNEVLNHMEVGLSAYKLGYYQQAKRSFDAAIMNIGSVYADSSEAKKARSLWYEEGRKDFKGEPYERAMVYFYRGLLYLQDADYENARASFINGIM